MGRRSWVVKATKEKFEQVLEIQKDYELFIVGAGLVKEPLRFLIGGEMFVEGDVVLLLQSDGEYVLRGYPQVFKDGYCLLENIHTIRQGSSSEIAELKYLEKKEELIELLNQFPTGHIYV
jgi:hypothetical protein